jgi:hypothetical protein
LSVVVAVVVPRLTLVVLEAVAVARLWSPIWI